MSKIFLADTGDYVVASGFDQATEKFIEIRGKDPVSLTLFKDTELVVTESNVIQISTGVLPALALADGALVSPTPEVFIKEGDSITLTATPSAGYTTFANWTDQNSVELSTSNPYTHVAGATDITINANFSV